MSSCNCETSCKREDNLCVSEINIRGRATVRNDTGRLPDEGDIPVGEIALPPLEEKEKRSFGIGEDELVTF